jgi:hypothetical protein
MGRAKPVKVGILATALLASFAAAALAQSGVEIAMPPNAHRTGGFPFANRCPTRQTFQIVSEPHVDWLQFEPDTVDVGPNSSFAVQVSVNAPGNIPLGTYRSEIHLICATCAASEPPCLQTAAMLPISLTVANIKEPGEFVNVTPSPVPVSKTDPQRNAPVPMLAWEMPSLEHQRTAALLAFGFLLAGSMGTAVALRGLFSRSRIRRYAGDDAGVETGRRRVRR